MGALDIGKGQVKNIYAIAAKLGMVDRSSHEDALHELVQGLTGKTSVKDLMKHRAASARRSRKKCGTSCFNLKSSTRHRRACSCVTVCAA